MIKYIIFLIYKGFSGVYKIIDNSHKSIRERKEVMRVQTRVSDDGKERAVPGCGGSVRAVGMARARRGAERAGKRAGECRKGRSADARGSVRQCSSGTESGFREAGRNDVPADAASDGAVGPGGGSFRPCPGVGSEGCGRSGGAFSVASRGGP